MSVWLQLFFQGLIPIVIGFAAGFAFARWEKRHE